MAEQLLHRHQIRAAIQQVVAGIAAEQIGAAVARLIDIVAGEEAVAVTDVGAYFIDGEADVVTAIVRLPRSEALATCRTPRSAWSLCCRPALPSLSV